MSKGTRTLVKHRTLWVSDVHLGSPGSKAKQLAEFLRRNECEQLYLVGDIFDGWKLKSRFYWTPDHSRVIKEVIAKARHGTQVYYLTGNHDDFMRQFVHGQLRLGKVRLANKMVHTTADGRRLLVTHGDIFDDVVNRFLFLAYAGDFAYEVLMGMNGMVNRITKRLGLAPWSLSAFAKTHVKAAVQALSGFDNKIQVRCERDRLAGVICGHTHHAEIRTVGNGIVSYNSGDWVESCTALAEDFAGTIRIVEYQPRAPQSEQPQAPVANTPAARLLAALPKAAERIQRRGAPPRRGLAGRKRTRARNGVALRGLLAVGMEQMVTTAAKMRGGGYLPE